ncbi:MAG: hypothetical protein V1792_11600 [Pseudomonadota bacterium]
MRNTHVVGMIVVTISLLIVSGQLGRAEDETKPSQDGGTGIMEQPGRLFDMKVPEGFDAVPNEEPGIFKWKKGSAEIYLVVGDLFVESGDLLFKALRKAAEDGEKIEKVETVKIDGGQAMLFKEKPGKDPERPLTWRLIVLMDKKMINVDFTAPLKDFESFRGDFQKAVESFKLKSDS